jgi:protein SCO1/2
MNMIHPKTLFLLSAGALALAMGIWLGQLFISQRIEPPLEIAGIYFSDPKDISDFNLVHQSGKPFTRENLRGKWNFLYFGYTYCPDVCPMTLSQLNAVDQRLAQQGLDQDTAYLMISVDPRRDTPERLGQYVTYFNKNFQGATGTPEELEKLAKQLGIFYKLNDQEDAENYTVDHSSAIILIDPDIKLRAIFTHPDQPDSLIADFTQIRTRYQTTR